MRRTHSTARRRPSPSFAKPYEYSDPTTPRKDGRWNAFRQGSALRRALRPRRPSEDGYAGGYASTTSCNGLPWTDVRRYHWALLIAPKNEGKEGRGWRFHAKDGVRTDGTYGWLFEEREIPLVATQMLLVRVCVGKIEKNDRVREILRQVPVRDSVEGWNCVSWVKEALRMLEADGESIGTSELDWAKVRDAAMAYVQKKKDEHRFDGRGSHDKSKVATFNLLEGKETIQ